MMKIRVMPSFTNISGFICFVSMSLLHVVDARGDALLVPQEYATISEAIEAAYNGDVIEVAAGVYEENLTIYDKQIGDSDL